MPRKIAIIGGGPKAAAIAAKACALANTGYAAPDIYIYEPRFVGAAWSGQAGYTDGIQSLCTPAERDLGYPYDRNFYGRDTTRFMFQRFSWQIFSAGDGIGATAYDNWLLHGRSPPVHRDFVRYLHWAVQRSGAAVIEREVTGIDYDNRQWQVTAAGAARPESYDGVVITGSGEPQDPLDGAQGNERVVDGKSFWEKLRDILDLLEGEDDPAVAVIGAGGFVPSAVPVRSGPAAYEAELYDPPDPEAEVRRRLGLPPPPPVTQPAGYFPATVFVDARGFNVWWFVDRLLSASNLHAHFTGANRQSVLSNIDYSLAVGGQFPPGLHVPMLASRQGPAAPNLMALGWISDRILHRYVTPILWRAQGRRPVNLFTH